MMIIMKTAILLLVSLSQSIGMDLNGHVDKTGPSLSGHSPRLGFHKISAISADSSTKEDYTYKSPELHITGGQVATRGQFPWTVFIQVDNAYICGGSLVSDEWILTAAECTYGFAMFQIYIGAQNWQDDEVDRLIVDTTNRIAHGDFDPNTFKNDIALIKLRNRIGLNEYIQPVTLPKYSMQTDDFTGTNATALGWGQTSDNDTTINTDLRFVSVRVVSEAECTYSWGDNIGPGNICTDATDGKSTCSGDNGGPLVSEDKVLIGIQSFLASNGCQKGIASVFTRVTHYLDWIEANSNIVIQK